MSDNADTLSQEDLAQLDQMRQTDTDTNDAAPAPAAPSPSPAAAEPAEPVAAGEDDQRAPSMVPYTALKAERDRFKEERERRQEAERRAQMVDQRAEQILQVMRAQQQQAAPQQAPTQPEVVDLNADPLRHILTRMEAQERTIASVTQGMQQAQQHAQQQAQYAQVVQQVHAAATAAETEFKRTTPDYDAATEHLVAQRHRVLALAGITDPAQRHQMIQQEALGIGARALQSGKNAAQMIYELAQAHGYQPATQSPQNGDQPNPGQRLQSVQAGQQQARSIGAVSGSGPAAKTADRLYKMSNEEFTKALKDPGWKALLG